MRIWDISPAKLCRNHLLGEHRELHAIWTILTKAKSGYRHHPETRRWKGKLKALYLRHEKLIFEMKRRGYNHNSILAKRLAGGCREQKDYLHTPAEQKKILKGKNCDCKI
ncbi:MAG: pyrimidine dimer DNA glycosylase/endonuclease V [Candidatus Omnitrophota bacterium]